MSPGFTPDLTEAWLRTIAGNNQKGWKEKTSELIRRYTVRLELKLSQEPKVFVSDYDALGFPYDLLYL